ncbi:hypothetical protein P175DRAFT_0452606 [Aspergillus ochraceoroseus IBT 24754]|uniref:D-serine dehydratase-like domain-containing protein n=2 Tax=Aspergillus ochraceoroseus TaxID=138278 RepID=A0A2T5M1D6_9EURO|nr:uncharacterized protein P175DRAFT_0452606 [Aspergillus ochraceoroseus IBT 24754]KKK23485.1 hypothetical protein AOCH_001472 [Aspergillus ochraceoroseus]PTU22336.1 hypothetical protein P175DRAFT_0452606 [Aspergillus ochraceoroseus IBT 24754]
MTASQQELREFYVGKDVGDVPKPAIVLDAAIIKRHCEAMLRTVELNVGFRAHVKSHKTTEIAEMQVGVGDNSLGANFIASTVLEIETLVPLLRKLHTEEARSVNVLYGIPLVPSQVAPLARAALEIGAGRGTLAVMIDHPDQVDYLQQYFALTNSPASVFVKVDTGYHRAGLPPAALNKRGLLEKLANAEKLGYASLLGFYSHSSLSYAGTTPEEAMAHLTQEIEGCKEALETHLELLPEKKELVISVGATPQALSSQNLLPGGVSSPEATALKNLLRNPLNQDRGVQVKIEIHAGVYPLLDMQQLSTHARNGIRNPEDEIAISVLAEVCSIYNDGERAKPEALLAAGTLALGREPCAGYPGWGVISSWRQSGGTSSSSSSSSSSRLIVERISQEHSVVSWENPEHQPSLIPLRIGQTVKIYPNHACVAAAFYGFYFVVDSDQDPEAARIVDVWVRARGSDITEPVLLPRVQ